MCRLSPTTLRFSQIISRIRMTTTTKVTGTAMIQLLGGERVQG